MSKGFPMSIRANNLSGKAIANTVQYNASEASPSPNNSILSLLSMQGIRSAAHKVSQSKSAGRKLHARDLINLLMCHTARSRRMAQPFATVRLVSKRNGRVIPVRFALKTK